MKGLPSFCSLKLWSLVNWVTMCVVAVLTLITGPSKAFCDTATTVSLTFNPNGVYTVSGPTDGLTITVPNGHDTGTTPSYNVTLPAQATNVVVTSSGGGGSADPADTGYSGYAGDKVQSSALTGILGVQLDLFVGQGANNYGIAWPDGNYSGYPGEVGASSSIYLHSGTVLKMLAGGGNNAYNDNGGPETRGPYNANSLGDFGGVVTSGAGGAGGGAAGSDGYITITYSL